MNKNQAVALITGALTGIGRATAITFAKAGYRVVVSGRREVEGAALVKELAGLGASAQFVAADVRDEAQVRFLVEAAVKAFGRIDVAVNNAGTEGSTGPISQQTIENYDVIFDTNVKGVLLSMKYEVPVMVAQGSGSIINLSSIAGHVGFPGASVYVASKHAVEGLTRTAALEVAASGVRVNAVAPGPVDTAMLDRFSGGGDNKAGLLAMMPNKRAAAPEEIAQAILYLASPAAAYVNGQILTLDGGYTAA